MLYLDVTRTGVIGQHSYDNLATPKQDLRVGEKINNESETLWTGNDEDSIDLMDVFWHTRPENIMLARLPEEFFQPIVDKLHVLFRI